MKNILTLILLLPFAAFSQQMIRFVDTTASNRLEVDGNIEYAASAIHRDFLNTMIRGGEITDEIKNSSFDRHKSKGNRIGFNANAEISYTHGSGKIFRDSLNLTWMVKAGYYAIGAGDYQKDLFGLAFYGNSPYLGESLQFDGTSFSFMQFQKIGFGLVGKRRGGSVTLNYINVQNYADAVIRSGDMSFAEDASQVDLALNGTFQSTYGQQFNKGFGFGMDFDFRLPVGSNSNYNNTTLLQITAQNIGFARINSGIARYETDSNWTYDGFTFDSFRDGNNPLGNDFDLLDSLGVQKDTIKRTVWLPGYIQVAKMVDPNSAKKVQPFFGIRFYPVFKGAPLLFAGAYWKATSFLHASGSLSYGNFGGFRGGIYATLALKKINLVVGTDDVVGLVSGRGYGESLIMRLVWKLN